MDICGFFCASIDWLFALPHAIYAQTVESPQWDWGGFYGALMGVIISVSIALLADRTQKASIERLNKKDEDERRAKELFSCAKFEQIVSSRIGGVLYTGLIDAADNKDSLDSLVSDYGTEIFERMFGITGPTQEPASSNLYEYIVGAPEQIKDYTRTLHFLGDLYKRNELSPGEKMYPNEGDGEGQRKITRRADCVSLHADRLAKAVKEAVRIMKV